MRAFTTLGAVFVALCGATLFWPGAGWAAERPKTVLIIDSGHPELPWVAEFRKGFSTRLATTHPETRLFWEYIDLARFPGEQNQNAFLDYIARKYAGMPVDAIVSRGRPSSTLIASLPTLFPRAERLYVDPPPELAQELELAPEHPAILAQADVVAGFDHMVDLMAPKRILIVGETVTHVSRQYIEQLRQHVPTVVNGAHVEYLLDLPMAQLLKTLANQPKGTAIYYTLVFRDGDNKRFVPFEAARLIAQQASAPVFSHWSTMMNSGIVGGYVLSAHRIGDIAASRLAISLAASLTDKAPRALPLAAGFVHMYDARALARFNISHARLPADSVLINQQPTFWETNRESVLLALAVVAALGIGFAVWIVTLRRAVESRTAEIRETNETLQFVTEQDTLGQDKNFFDSLARHLGEILGVDFAFIDIIAPGEKQARTVGLYALGAFPGNIEYDLADTPCANVYGKQLCCYPNQVQQQFPKDQLLKDMGAESYVGIPLWGSTGDPIGLIAVLDRKPLKNVEHIKATLRMVALRAAQELEHLIVEDSLIAAKDEAETANLAKSEFLANMSHELRTPLNSIIGFAEMMKYQVKGAIPEGYREYNDHIIQSGRLLLETINGVLDLAKIEAGKFELFYEPANMADILEEVLGLMDVQTRQKGLQLVNDCAPLPTMNIDPMRIKQVLMNIIGNAVKFTDEGNITVTSQDDASGWNLVISDTGIGMTPDQIEIALEPFRQVHGHAMSRRFQGTGLGLSFSRQVMQLHGGELHVESAPNKGTRVTLRFPKDVLAKPTEQGQGGQDEQDAPSQNGG